MFEHDQMAGVALLVLGCSYIAAATFGMLRYRTPLNPLTFAAVVGGGITTLSGAIVYMQLQSAPYSDSDVAHTAWVSLAQLAGTVTPYFFRGRLLARVFGQIVRWLGLDSELIAVRFGRTKFLLLLLTAAACYVGLAILGGGGLRWLTDTRNAYIQNRAGAGPLFAATEWFLVFALIYFLWSRRNPTLARTLPVTLLFALAASMTGSKANILIMGVVLIVFYQYRVRPIPPVLLSLIIPLFLATFTLLLIVQGFGENNPLLALVYFKDYFDTATQFLSRFSEFGYRYGGVTLSGLWYYVPRALYPAKPYEYGVLLVHRVLFVGAAETGNTPGALTWIPTYMDFGVLGVYLSGVLDSFSQRGAYEYFLGHRREFFAFLFMMQFSLWAPLPFATAGITIVLSLVVAFFFRLTTRSTRRSAAFSPS